MDHNEKIAVDRLAQDDQGEGKKIVDRKKELKKSFKEDKPQVGIYQIKNTKNNKVLVASSLNLKTINGAIFQLKMGSHKNSTLQDDWKKYGEECFLFEILEVLKQESDDRLDIKRSLAEMEERWLEQLQPYDERGYNVRKVVTK